MPEVSERIIRATLTPRMAPSWNTANTVPFRFDITARGLAPDERSASLACSLPSSLSKSAALRNSGKARTPTRSLRSVYVGLPADASTVNSPLAWPP